MRWDSWTVCMSVCQSAKVWLSCWLYVILQDLVSEAQVRSLLTSHFYIIYLNKRFPVRHRQKYSNYVTTIKSWTNQSPEASSRNQPSRRARQTDLIQSPFITSINVLWPIVVASVLKRLLWARDGIGQTNRKTGQHHPGTKSPKWSAPSIIQSIICPFYRMVTLLPKRMVPRYHNSIVPWIT